MLKDLAFGLLRYSGLPWLIRETLQRHVITILLYHDVEPKIFRQQIAFLRKRYSIISLQDILRLRDSSNPPPLPAKAMVITFDDGHCGNFALLETLVQSKVPATIFLCSGIVGTNRRYWFKNDLPRAELIALKAVPDSERLRRLRDQGFEDECEYDQRQALSWHEVLAMKPHVDFQSHTVSHPILPKCNDDKSRRELAESKRQLEEKLGAEINSVAYPNGDYSGREVELARSLGYRCALTEDFGFNTSRTDPFRLKRIWINDAAGANEMIVRSCGLWGALRAMVK
jgi:peptidoglycan/xylan/chitin deacetylase (PgdA/CDA1 family)